MNMWCRTIYLDILLSYSLRIFGAQLVTSLQHGSLSSNLIGLNDFLGPRRLPRGKTFNTFQYALLQRGMSLGNPLL